MDKLQTLKALEILRGTSDYWTEEEASQLSDLDKWIQWLQDIDNECTRRGKQAGIITLSIKNEWRTIYTRELKDTLKAYIENGAFPADPDSYSTEAYREAEAIHKAVHEDIGWWNDNRE